MREPDSLRIRTEWRGTECWVILTGELDIGSAPNLRDFFRAFLPEEKDLFADLTGLSFLDSTGIAVLIGAARRLGGPHVHLRVSERQRRLLKVMGLDQLFHLA